MSIRARALRLGCLALAVATQATLARASAAEGPGPEPLEPIPSERQRAWHDLELYGCVRIGPRTFGEGQTAGPFAPTDLDCRQWAAVASDAGLAGLILSVRPDGFTLWPSAHGERGVQTSAWRDGRGDVVRELAEACREHGLRMGIEVSAGPDLVAQLEELSSGYGELFEIRLIGAPDDPDAALEVVRRLQPSAVIANGPDVRVIAPDGTPASTTSWSPLAGESFWAGELAGADLATGDPSGGAWVPAEASFALRPTRFWHAGQRVRDVGALERFWRHSVGRNAALCISLTPDRRGRIPAADATVLKAFGALLEATYGEDVARGARALSDQVRSQDAAFQPRRVVDGDAATYWATADGVFEGQLEIDLGVPATFNRVVLCEAIELGQRVTSYSIEVFEQGGWRRIAEGTTIGRKRIEAFEAVKARRVLLNLGARAPITLSTFGLHLTPPSIAIVPAGKSFVGSQVIQLVTDVPGAAVHYTVDGSEPTEASPLYEAPLKLTTTMTVRARAFFEGQRSSLAARETYTAWSEEQLLHPLHLLRAPDAGLRWQSFEGPWTSLAAVDWSKPVADGVSSAIDADLRTRRQQVALAFDGYLRAPVDGVYRFEARSPDAYRIVVGDRVVGSDEGGPEETGPSEEIGLRSGWHPFRVELLDTGGDTGLTVTWSGPGFEGVDLPADVLGH